MYSVSIITQYNDYLVLVLCDERSDYLQMSL